VGTSLRHGCKSLVQFEILPRPPDERGADNPWPQWPNVFRVSSAHEEGGDRVYSVSTQKFTGDDSGRVTKLHGSKVELVRKDGRMSFEPVPGSEFEMDVDLVLLAMGFLHPEPMVLEQLGVERDDRGNAAARRAMDDERARGVHRRRHATGPVLIVWAIAEGAAPPAASISS
jgi:glutamate synthase (NADPH/NADH) small chain